MITKRTYLTDLIEQGVIEPQDVEETLKASGIFPAASAWRAFIDGLLLWLAALALASSVIFFIAYNWTELGRFAKFALIELLILGAVLSYYKFADSHVAGKVSLMMASLFLGALLALYGQVYQTGADTWELFFNWSLLMLPWVLIARFAALWLFWLVLINLSLILYQQVFGGILGAVFRSDETMFWSVFGFNSLALFSWELAARRWSWLKEPWAPRIIACAAGVPITGLCIFALFDNTSNWALLGWAVFISALYLIYRRLVPDLFMLAAACLSTIVTLTAFFAKGLFEIKVEDEAIFLLLAILVIGLASAAAFWLRSVNREFSA